MHFTRSIYPDYPGTQGDPCWKLTGRWIDIDADWNTRFPYGTSFALHIGRQDGRLPNSTPGFLLDLNAPIGEPNRLYVWVGRWHVTLGLLSVRDFRETGRNFKILPSGGTVTEVRGEHFSNWRHPHIDGCDRYRYHQDETGKWVRNSNPEPLHWGWLTIDRRSQR